MKIVQKTVQNVAKVNRGFHTPRVTQIPNMADDLRAKLARPTLLVPIHLDALVVDEDFHSNGAQNKRADIRYQKADPFHPRFNGGCEFFNEGDEICTLDGAEKHPCSGVLADCLFRRDTVKPEPFTAAVPTSNRCKAPDLFEKSALTLKEGVHLHWSMPDALTKGYMIGEDDDSDVVFPDLPNRWLVVRTVARDCTVQDDVDSEHKKQIAEAWVIIADGGQLCEGSRRTRSYHRIVPLNDFDESKCQRQHLAELTAISGGDPSAIVFYDSCYDTFAFYDSQENLAGIKHGPLGYQVFGWFAGESESPLSDIRSKEDLKRILEMYHWKIGLDLNQEVAALAEESDDSEDTGALGADFRWQVGCDLLCHASVHGVQFKQSGSRAFDRRPDGSDLFIGLGSSQEGAMGGWLSYVLGNTEGYGCLLAGFMDGQLAEVTKMDQMNSFNFLIHKRGFASLDGGTKLVPVSHSIIEPLERKTKKGWIDFEELERKDMADMAVWGREPKRLSVVERLTEKNIDSFGAEPFSDTYKINGIQNDVVTMRDGLQEMRQSFERVPPPSLGHFIEQPQPRFYQPKDPVLVIAGANRGIKHGEDGRFDNDGNLLCRLSEDCIRQVAVEYYETFDEYIISHGEFFYGGGTYAVPLQGIEPSLYAVVARDLLDFTTNGDIPAGISNLVGENMFFDSASVERFAEIIIQNQLEDGVNKQGERYTEYLATCYRDQVYMKPQEVADAGVAALVRGRNQALAEDQPLLNQTFSGDGRLPSPHGLRRWEQPWTPIHLDWHVSITPSRDGVGAWELDGAVFQPKEGTLQFDDSKTIVLKGRSLLTPGAAKTMHRALQSALLKEKTNDYIADEVESSLSELTEQMGMVNLIGSSLGGFHDMLLGKVEEYLLDDETEQSDGVLSWLREGQLTLHRLRIVDSFGRYLDTSELNDGAGDTILGADGVFTMAEKKNSLLIPPRITSPARLTFRFLDGRQTGLVEADEKLGTSGICGWCMPDHLDGALEFFDVAGHNIGQLNEELSLSSSHTNVIWEGVPGEDGSYGEPLVAGQINPHLQGMIDGLRSWNEFDQTEEADESSLSAMIRAIDVNGWGVDPFGRTGSDHLAVLLGKPLAVVRAMVSFELKEDSSLERGEDFDAFCRIPFPVLIGNVKNRTDGVMGFYINDDYQHLHLPDPETKKTAFAKGLQGATQNVPITHPYIFDEHALYVRVGQTVTLTMLVDPRGGIHASTGLLPQKRLDLIQEEIKPALDTMAVTFMIGPVLVDPAEVKMPHPNDIKGNWNWLHRSSPVMWQEKPVTPADDRARFSQQGLEIHDGWLKFSGGIGDGNKG